MKNYSVAYHGIYPCCQWNVYRIIIIFKGSEYKHIAAVSQDYFLNDICQGFRRIVLTSLFTAQTNKTVKV